MKQLILAPMDDVTDTAFRRVVVSTARPDIFFTEFVNVDGLQSPGRSKLLPKLAFTNKETPLIAQIWGKRPENYLKTAQELASGQLAKEANNAIFATNSTIIPGEEYAGVDINMGCPDKTIVKNGCCSALIDNRTLTDDIITATKEGLDGKLPLSVKTRIGFKEVDLTWIEHVLQHKLSMLTIHLRTAKEMSKVPAHWGLMSEIKKLRDTISPTTALIGNGDVENKAQAQKLVSEHSIDGVMIGRGIFSDPYALASKSTWQTKTKHQKLALYKKHIDTFIETYKKTDQEGGGFVRSPKTLNKFCKVYIQGFNGAKELRELFMNTPTVEQLVDTVQQAIDAD